jgi:hypothetical protein
MDYMKQLRGDAKSARVSFPAACCDKMIFTTKDTPQLAVGRFIFFLGLPICRRDTEGDCGCRWVLHFATTLAKRRLD